MPKYFNNCIKLITTYVYVTDHLPIEMLQQKRNFYHYSIKPDKKAKERHGKS